MARVITITSGKGGVGKTSISLNLSLALASAGNRVCLFDADLGLANVNILTGIYPEYGLEEVFSGRMDLEEIMVMGVHGVDIIPGASGVKKMADLTATQARRLIDAFLELTAYDYFIFDTSAGISAQVLAFCRASHEMVLVVTPEPTSLTDAYSLLKVLAREDSLPMPPVRVVVNQVKTGAAAKTAWAKLRQTVEKFLAIPVSPLGIVAQDPNVPIAVVSQIPFFAMFPDTSASQCIRKLAAKLAREPGPGRDKELDTFWDQCLNMIGVSSVEDGTSEEAEAPALNARLSAIEEKIALLLSEVSEIKTMLGSPSNRGPETRRLPDQPSDLKIPLDFESWLAAQPPR